MENCHSADPTERKLFEQPVIQSLQMFMGEGGCCWLVILLGVLYNRAMARLGRVSPVTPVQDIVYQPVDTDEADDPTDDGRDVYDPSTIVAKPPQHRPRQPLAGWSLLWLVLPTFCDTLGTTTMQVGLLFIAASIYQMVRGFLVIWVGLFSVLFLHRHLGAWKWISMVIVVAGIAVVGLAGILDEQHTTPHVPGASSPKETSDLMLDHGGVQSRATVHAQVRPASAASTLLGVMLVAGAQVFTASQFVIEERIMEKYHIDPIKLVSWEGTFGVIITLIGLLVLHVTVGMTPAGRGGYFDAVNGFRQVFESKPLLVSSVLTMISIAYVSTEVVIPLVLTKKGGSTSLAYASQNATLRPPVARSMPAVHWPSGPYRSDSAGSPSNGCK